jgi:uncharacterized protein YwlG (UPF0340 family)
MPTDCTPVDVIQQPVELEVLQVQNPIDILQTSTEIDIEASTSPIDVVQTSTPIDVVQTTVPLDISQSLSPIEVVQTSTGIEITEVQNPIELIQSTPQIEIQQTSPVIDVSTPGVQGVPGLGSPWITYAMLWDTAPTVAGSVAAGTVFTYTLDGNTRYRLVPEPYDPSDDAFYGSFAGMVLSDLIVARA